MATKKSSNLAYHVHLFAEGDRAEVEFLRSYENYRNEVCWDKIGSLRFWRSLRKDGEPETTKEKVMPYDAAYGPWFGGKHWEPASTDIEDAYETIKVVYDLRKRILATIRTYNLDYRYDEIGAWVAAMNRLGIGEMIPIKNAGEWWVDHYEQTDRHTWAK